MLVEQKLAACCNLIPGLTSIYEWQVWHLLSILGDTCKHRQQPARRLASESKGGYALALAFCWLALGSACKGAARVWFMPAGVGH